MAGESREELPVIFGFVALSDASALDREVDRATTRFGRLRWIG
jgi:hypothetical protein